MEILRPSSSSAARLRQFFSPQISLQKENRPLPTADKKSSKRALSSKMMNGEVGALHAKESSNTVFSRARLLSKANKISPNTATKVSEAELSSKPSGGLSRPTFTSHKGILSKPTLNTESFIMQRNKILREGSLNVLIPKKPAQPRRESGAPNRNESQTKRDVSNSNSRPHSVQSDIKCASSVISSILKRQVQTNVGSKSKEKVGSGSNSKMNTLDQPGSELASISLNFFQLSTVCLLEIKNKIVAGHETANEVQEFLEKNRFAPELEKRLKVSIGPIFTNLFYLQKLSLLMVLFTINYVEIRVFRHSAMMLIEEFLVCFFLSINYLKSLSGGVPENAEIQNFISSHPELAFTSTHPGDILKSLQAAMKSAKRTLIELVFNIYRSRDLCVRLESLSLEAEKMSCLDVQINAFDLFEKLLRGSVGEIAVGQEVVDISFSFDSEDPNFILQPIKMEKYLPYASPEETKITLVLDLDETLVHFEESPEGGEFLVRPQASEFLEQMAKLFEVVVFTAAMKDYADWILDRIDPNKNVSHRLYRQHTQPHNGIYLKDLNRLGRDLARVIIVDNSAENFQLQPENGINIKTWHNDPNDNALIQLSKLLTLVGEKNPKDVREFLRELQLRKNRKIKNQN